MSEWITPAREDISIDHSDGSIDIFIELNDFGARYITIPLSVIYSTLSIPHSDDPPPAHASGRTANKRRGRA